jgi:ribose transport system permease protein
MTTQTAVKPQTRAPIAALRVRSRAGMEELLERHALVVLLAAVFAFFALAPRSSSSFFSVANIQSVLGNQAILGVLAVGTLAPMICRNYDLSVGATAGLVQIAVAASMSRHHWPLAIAIAIGIGIGAFIGLINGLIVTRFGVNAIVTTLGVGAVLVGIVNAYTAGSTIVTGISQDFVAFGSANWVGIPTVTLVLLLVALVSVYVLDHVPFGRNLNFVGSNPSAAKLAGLNVDRLVQRSFVMSGTFAAVAGILLVARNGTGDPQAGNSYTLQALAAAALGAAAIRPGRFNVAGTLVAVFFLGFGINGLTLFGVPFWINDVFFGGALVIGVGASSLLGRRRIRAAV